MAVRVEKSGRVTTVIIDRPKRRNAVDRATATELAEAFEAFDRDPEARVGVLWGAGGTFCAGADLKAMVEGSPNRLEPVGHAPMGPSRMLLSKPVIAAISGHAVAGGLELALWCDLRIAEAGAQLGVFCRRWGVPLIDGGTVRLPRLIGLSRALDLVLTGRAVSAKEALTMGLVNRLVAEGNARQAAENMAADMARFPQVCLRSDRRSLYESGDLSLVDAMEREFTLGQRALREEAFEGARRFAAGVGRNGAMDTDPADDACRVHGSGRSVESDST